MDNLIIAATKRTPAVNFNFDENDMSILGESYPEDVNHFYGEIISQLDRYLARSNEREIVFTFELVYFNSSSAKAMIRIFDMLDAAAKQNKIRVLWLHDIADDNMAELGEEFGEDLENATFELIVKEFSVG